MPLSDATTQTQGAVAGHRGKKSRARGPAIPGMSARPQAPPRRRAAAPKPPRRSEPEPPPSPRIAAARRRARRAKGTLAVVAAVVFGAAAVLARASYAGHPKHRPTALAAPPGFVQIVRQNLLEAGLLAPADAPPGAATSVS
jgi:hypothetical protein